jgi:hypothetical protein
LDRQQVVFAHQTRHPLMIDEQTAPPQFCGHAALTVATPMFQHDLLNRGPHSHLFFGGQTFLQQAIEVGATYLRQLTYPFNTQAALQRHHFPDLVVDTFAPLPPLCWRLDFLEGTFEKI